MSIHSCANSFPGREPASIALLHVFAALGCALSMPVAAHSQTTTPDFEITDWREPGAPRPNGQITAWFKNNGSPASITSDAVLYRGSRAAGTATEILRKPLTFAQGAYATFDSGPTIPFTEGDIFTVCIDPDHTIAESNYNNNCYELVVSSGYTDLSIDVTDISMSPLGPPVGQPVTVKANIRNKYNVTAKTLVRLFQGHPNTAGSKLLGQNNVSIPPNGAAATNWTVTRPPGDSNFWIQLEDVYPRDVTPSDNLASRNLFLKAIVNSSRTSPGAVSSLPWASSPAVGDLLGTGQPVTVFAEYLKAGTLNAEARITALQVLSDGSSRELWSKNDFLPPPADAIAPALADIDGDGQPEVIFEAVHRNVDSSGGQIGVFVLNKDGSLKWQHTWNTIGRVPCHNYVSNARPALGDMNGDGVVDITVLESDFVVLDGRNGNELARRPISFLGVGNCSSYGYSAVADVDGDGKNEYIVGDYGIHVLKSDGSLLWEYAGNNLYAFALLDLDRDGKAEVVVPVHRQQFLVLNAANGQVKQSKIPSGWTPFSQSIAATTSVGPVSYPSLVVANNDYQNGTALLDNTLNQKWFKVTPPVTWGLLDNPSYVVLADLFGQGRPQVISHSNYRNLGIQDIATGEWIEYFDISGGFVGSNSFPIPVDIDGDGRGEIIASYALRYPYSASFEPRYPTSQFLVFGSDSWKKIPTVWNQTYFVPNQVDEKLAFKHDYKPWTTHNTWMQQPPLLPSRF
jgi:hypothetical protein